MKHSTFVHAYKCKKLKKNKTKKAIRSKIGVFVAGVLVGVMVLQVFAANLIDNTSLMYPLQEVSKLSCRQIEWTQVPPECKIPLPRIKNASYGSFSNNKDYTDIYGVLYKGSYEKEKRNQLGSHPGVDISTSQGTPVYAIADGVVYDAKFQAGYGNVVKLQFKYKGVIYYATYAHLSEINVTKGASVKKGQILGKVGNSGVAGGTMGGYHLHFEINKDDKGKLTYAFWECPEWQMGSNEVGVVNQGLCRDKLEARTVDPIVFLEQANATIQATTTNQGTEKPTTTPIVENKTDTTPNQGNTKQQDKPLVTTPAGSSEIQIATIDKRLLSPNARQFLDTKTRKATAKIPNPLALGAEGVITISLINTNNGTTYNGTLPVPVEVVPMANKISVSPKSIGLLQGEAKIKVVGKAIGEDIITLRYDGQLFAKVGVNVGNAATAIADSRDTPKGKYKCRALVNKEKMFF